MTIIIKYFKIVIKMFGVQSNITFLPVYNFSQHNDCTSIYIYHLYKKHYLMVSMMCISCLNVSNVSKMLFKIQL